MGSKKEWYAIHTYSGHEDKVKANLEQRIKTTGMEDNIFQILIPKEDKVKVKDGKKKVVKDKIFPGYVLIEMIMTNDSWYVVRNTPGVIGFASAGTKPVPVQGFEMRKVLDDMELETPKTDIDLEKGDKVKLISGPFAEHVGEIEKIDPKEEQLTVIVNMFGGRETPIDIEFTGVEKI